MTLPPAMIPPSTLTAPLALDAAVSAAVLPGPLQLPPALPEAAARLFAKAQTAAQSGDDATTLANLREAVRQYPDHAALWAELAVASSHAQHNQPTLEAAARALALDPGCARAWCARARALLRMQRLSEAKAALDQAEARTSGDPLVMAIRATTLMLENQNEAADALFRQSRAADPTLAEATANHAQLLIRLGMTAPALEAIRLAVAQRPLRGAFHYLLGHLLNQARQDAQAIPALQKALELEPGLIPARMDLSTLLCRNKQPDAAEAVCREGLAITPDHISLLVNLGAALQEQNRRTEARTLYLQVLARDATLAAVHNNLAKIAEDEGQYETALHQYQQAAALEPDNPDYQRNLSLLQQRQAQAQAAGINRPPGPGFLEPSASSPLSFSLLPPTGSPPLATANAQADVLTNQAATLAETGQLADAIALYQEALRLNPRHLQALVSLGALQIGREDLDAAEVTFRQAILYHPLSYAAYANLGNIHKLRGQIPAALAAFRHAYALNPKSAEVLCNYALCLNTRAEWREMAEQVLKQAAILAPDLGPVWSNLGIVLQQAGRFNEAEVFYHRALENTPDNVQVMNNLGISLASLGRFQEADQILEAACLRDPTFPQTSSNRLFYSNYNPDLSADALYALHCQWDARHGSGLIPRDPPPQRPRDPDRPLTVGFISPDFGQHPVGYFSVPVFAYLDRQAFSIVAYSQRGTDDPTTGVLRQNAGLWRDILGLSDTALAQQIRDDGIDILIDLGGHTGGQRMAVFARKPAPVQITWLGYPNTTGLSTMDYRMTDAIADPPGSEIHCRETLIRLPHGFHCYVPAPNWPESGPLPARTAGYVTFGTFNNLMKVTSQSIALWAEILHAVPESRFWIKNYQIIDPVNRGRIRGLFAAHGIDSRRIDIMPWLDNPFEHLDAFRKLDIALDTFPYNGTTTTCDALWMGVPVVTLSGDRHAARVGASLLTHAGHPELIARTPDDYRRIAVSLAQDLPRLEALRQNLRPQMRASPLNDGPSFGRYFGEGLRAAWRRWCASPES